VVDEARFREGENEMKRCMLVGFVVLACCGLSWAAEEMTLDAALKAMPTYEFGQSRLCLTVISDAVRDSYGDAAARKDLMNKLVAVLGSDATFEAKQFACRELSTIGTEDIVPNVAKLLGDEKTADMARYALERIPGAAADKALLAALGKASGLVKVGIINSLGVRGCEDAVSALSPLVADSDATVAEAALAAIGKIGGADATAALVDAKGKVAADLHVVWADAYLICADGFLAAGDKGKAASMYEELSGAGEPDRVRAAALKGQVNALGEKGVPIVSAALTGDNATLRGVAAMFVRTLEASGATDAFAGALDKMDAGGQVLLINALADRGDTAAFKAVAKLAQSEDEAVSVAAVAAMGKLGDASCIGDLAKVAATAGRKGREAARNSLAILRGEDVDAAIVACMKKRGAEERVELVRALGARNAVAQVPALLDAAKDSEEAVRAEAFEALALLAPASEAATLVALLESVEGDKARKEAEDAVVAVSKKNADAAQRAAAVLAVLPKVKKDGVRCSMLKVLGQIGDHAALPTLREAADNRNDAIRGAAVRALADWPSAEVLDDLVTIGENTKSDTHRTLVVRGLVRLLEGRPAAEALKYFEKAMAMASSANEKKTVLGGLAKVNDPAALKLVEPYLNDKELAEEAKLAAEKIKNPDKK